MAADASVTFLQHQSTSLSNSFMLLRNSTTFFLISSIPSLPASSFSDFLAASSFSDFLAIDPNVTSSFSTATVRKVWIVVGAVTFAAALISSVVLVAVAEAGSTAIGPIGALFKPLWQRWKGVWERESGVLEMVRKESSLVICELDRMTVAVEKLEMTLGSMARKSEKDEAAREGMEEMRKKVVEFRRSMKGLEGEVDWCCRKVTEASAAMLQTITGET